MEPIHQQILQHLARHVSLTAEEQELFISLVSTRQLLRKQFLLQAGDVCRYESYVLDGCLRSFFVDDKGDEHTLHFALEDWWITDLESFLHHTAARVNIEALTPVRVLQLDKPSLERLYAEAPVFERFFRILHQNAYLAQNRRILNNISMNGEARYVDLLQHYPQLVQRVPQKYIASYLGITPVFLSQIRAKLGHREEE
ncbi:Crp/Fnr family transcriptional regulator [uncultured Chitinophaga sp.]|jgi:cAMP-binding proteins - catabolite gene activator and regulatory subunit of cAMP-dependent protein kinases|uniref:Crp/Fnr family transcriptional regulator n=1 Tax=uncultured Chitinophaga sp. TaxID=339340 RepID=UPI002622FED4|nr:Crp/Fnr family transcriptional regulator [uncultured Chitinophaga sp.]